MPRKRTGENAIAKRLQDLDLSFEKGARWLADKGVDISGSYLAMIANGREPSLSLARKLAKAFDLKVSDVVQL